MTASAPRNGSLLVSDARTRRRNAAEMRFRTYGVAAIAVALGALAILLATIVVRGAPAFTQTRVSLPVYLDPERLDPSGHRDPSALKSITTFRYAPVLAAALRQAMIAAGISTPDTDAEIFGERLRMIDKLTPGDALAILSPGARAQVRYHVLAHPEDIGRTVTFDLLVNSRIDGYFKGRVSYASAEKDGRVTAGQIDLARGLQEAGLLRRAFNLNFITGADASESRPEAAGFGVAVLGSLYMILTVLALALPTGVAAAVWLEEFAPRNRWTDLIEVNISNLAAVPSIVFGILGLAFFIQFAGLPQSAPLVGGLVLSLMTLPRIIIPARAALSAVPPGVRDAALGVGASRMQAVFHHVLPLATPGILTGLILGLSQALGETAPLLLIGMVGYVATNYPTGILEGLTSPNSAMPAQIYEWAKRADPAYYERAWGGIIILLVFMVLMNIIAIVLRRKFERRW